MAGIVVKIWNIKAGEGKRSSSTQIRDSISYITNEEKCNVTLSDGTVCQMGRELTYVTNDVKTLEGLYTGGIHILDVKNATNEMMRVKEFHGKLGGRIALHGIISLDEKESDETNAGKLMFLMHDLMGELFPEHQVVYAVHVNTDNLHIHFIVNTVGLQGKKIHMDKQFMRKVMEPAVNRLAVKYGFTPNSEWREEPKVDRIPFVERKIQLRALIDEGIEQSEDMESFLGWMKAHGVRVNVGKDLSLQFPDMAKRIRSYELGQLYRLDVIAERIVKKRDPFIIRHAKQQAKHLEEMPMAYYVPDVLKKFKDLNEQEKKEIIRQLRAGRNPWQERREQNWQIKRMSDDLSRTAHVYDIAQYYAPDQGIKEAKEIILQKKKQILSDKKEIRANLKRYRPITRLYEEMKQYERKAYLFEFADEEEYLPEYEKYRELYLRLREGYGKSIQDVAAYLEEQKDALSYVNAQLEELGNQYRILHHFEQSHQQITTGKATDLFSAVGHQDALKEVREYHSITTRLVYLQSVAPSDVFVQVLTTPDVVDAKATITTCVTIFDKKGKKVEEITSRDIEPREFYQKLNALKKKYDLKQVCYIASKEDGMYQKKPESEDSQKRNPLPLNK